MCPAPDGAGTIPLRPAPSPRSRLLRRLAFAGLLALALIVLTFVRLGAFLAADDPLTKADAILVLGGTLADRPLEAADLFKQGYAPRIVLTRGPDEDAVARLRGLGIEIETQFDQNQEILKQLGVPEQALIVPDRIHDNTADEAQTLRALVDRHRWRSVIVVTSTYHLRRSGLAMRRALRGTATRVVLRGSRYDDARPDEWWKRRRDIRWVASELPKLLAYAVGLG